MSGRQQRVTVQPINIIFKYLQQGQPVSVWLYDVLDFRLEGKIIGFDEFMNVVMDDVSEVRVKPAKVKVDSEGNAMQQDVDPSRQVGARKHLGRMLLKGENITLIQPV